MVQRYSFPQQTQIANVGDPTDPQDAATKNYVDTHGGGGGGTLQSLTDVQITEPVLARVGTFTVTAINPSTQSIDVNASVIGQIAVGDYLRGNATAGATTQEVINISPSGTNIEFTLDPSGQGYTVGGGIYRLPDTIESANLTWSNRQNKWIALTPQNYPAADIFGWKNKFNQSYVTDLTIPIVNTVITTNPSSLSGDWGFATQVIAGLTDGSEVFVSDNFGRTATGRYVSGASAGIPAVLADVVIDRESGGSWDINASYAVSIRTGILDTATTSFAFRDDVIYDGSYDDSTGTGDFVGLVESTSNVSGYGTITLTSDTQDATYVQGVALTWQGTPPTLLVNNTSIVVFSQAGLFNLTSALLDVSSGSPAVYTVEGELNCNSGYPVLAGTYPVRICRLVPQAVTAINGLQKGVTLAAGNGVTLTTSVSAGSITISAAGGAASSNFTSFVNQISGFKTIVNTDNTDNSGYIGLGFDGAFEVNDGGLIGSTRYISTTTQVQTEGVAVLYPVAATYAELEFEIDTPALTFNFTTQNSDSASNFVFVEVLLAKQSSSNATGMSPYYNAQIFPGFTKDSPGSDAQALVDRVSPTFVVTGSGTSFAVTMSAGVFNGISNNYTHTDITTGYIPYIRFGKNNGINPITSITNVQFTGAQGGMRSLVALPGVGGATPSLQQVMTVGNTTKLPLVLQDAQASPHEINLGVPATITANYNITLPASQGADRQVLENDGLGNLSWVINGGPVKWGVYATNARYNTGSAPILNVTANFTVPSTASVVGTVHFYEMYTDEGDLSPLYRFVPDTDAVLTGPSYDSFWSGFNGTTTLSGLLAQRGIF